MHVIIALILWLFLSACGVTGGNNSKYMMKQGSRAGRRMFR